MRILAALAAAAALSLAACDQQQTASDPGDAEQASTGQETAEAGAALGEAAEEVGEAAESATNDAANAVDRATDDNEATEP
jgi:hypothetical protein